MIRSGTYQAFKRKKIKIWPKKKCT